MQQERIQANIKSEDIIGQIMQSPQFSDEGGPSQNSTTEDEAAGECSWFH